MAFYRFTGTVVKRNVTIFLRSDKLNEYKDLWIRMFQVFFLNWNVMMDNEKAITTC